MTIAAVVFRTAIALGLVAPLARAQGATIGGIVLDSVHRRPLVGAAVQLVDLSDPSRGRTAATDSTGHYHFADVARGRYLVGFVHDALDSLGLDPPRVALTVRSETHYVVPLGIPSPATLIKQLCKADVSTDSTGLFLGRLRRSDGTPPAQGGISVSWTELRFTRRGLQRESPSQRADAGADGWFAVCGIPLGTPFGARAWAGGDSTGFVELDLPAGGILRRDMVVGHAVATVTAVTKDRVQQRDGLTPTVRRDTVALTRMARGQGSVRGTVRVLTGAPLRDVRIAVWGTGVEATTDMEGGFALDSVPEGTQTIVARSIGFVPYRAAFDVMARGPTQYDITLAPFVASLDTLRVRVDRVTDSWRAGFDSRMRRGFGEFLTEDEISKRNPQQVSDLFRDMAGLDILTWGAFGRKVVMRGRAGGLFCIPAVFVDGRRFYTGQSRPGQSVSTDFMEYTGTADLEFVVSPLDIKAVEVYAHDSSVPLEYDDPRDGCGSIVIWTGARKRR